MSACYRTLVLTGLLSLTSAVVAAAGDSPGFDFTKSMHFDSYRILATATADHVRSTENAKSHWLVFVTDNPGQVALVASHLPLEEVVAMVKSGSVGHCHLMTAAQKTNQLEVSTKLLAQLDMPFELIAAKARKEGKDPTELLEMLDVMRLQARYAVLAQQQPGYVCKPGFQNAPPP